MTRAATAEERKDLRAMDREVDSATTGTFDEYSPGERSQPDTYMVYMCQFPGELPKPSPLIMSLCSSVQLDSCFDIAMSHDIFNNLDGCSIKYFSNNSCYKAMSYYMSVKRRPFFLSITLSSLSVDDLFVDFLNCNCVVKEGSVPSLTTISREKSGKYSIGSLLP